MGPRGPVGLPPWVRTGPMGGIGGSDLGVRRLAEVRLWHDQVVSYALGGHPPDPGQWPTACVIYLLELFRNSYSLLFYLLSFMSCFFLSYGLTSSKMSNFDLSASGRPTP